MRNMKRSFIWLSFVFLLYACGKSQSSVCNSAPEGFSEADLVGTWAAGWSRPGKPDDTLIIREDGTYKQILDLERAEGSPFKYESDWQPWWIEYAENGLPFCTWKVCACAPIQAITLTARWSAAVIRLRQDGMTPAKKPGSTCLAKES
jgi:hypothetical protein